MTQNDLKQIRTVIKEEVGSAVKREVSISLEPVNNKLNSIDSRLGNVEGKLEALWDQVIEVTAGLDEVKETQQLHTTVLKRIEAKTEHNSDNIHRLGKRAITAERTLGISAPPEFMIIE